ncbi:S1 family peptidase [Streptomyces sp. SCSIO ZS0520]|uniref:S1 family peptidase n=1 Tax=Streptomyces sp. SCSIO ZS0520 TaxID=2892996 RepID=UPI0021DA8E04|nr:S1 family peptidase [Streptomyces sp. SCSIO ZS0520]
MRRVRTSVLALTAAGSLAAGLGITLGAPASAAPAPTAEASSPRYEPAMVEALAADLGTDTSGAIDRLDAQARQQKQLDRLDGRGVEADGAFFDAAGRLTVNVADRTEAAQVREAGLRARIPVRGEAALTEIKAALDASASRTAPAGVASWGVDVAGDTVTVALSGSRGSADAAFLKKAASYGEAVRVVKGEGTLSPQAVVPPGSRMTLNNNDNSWCSVGYGARNSSGKQFLVTAGHCVASGPGLYFNRSRFAVGTYSRYAEGRDSVDMGLATLDSGSSIGTAVGTWGNGSSVAVRGSQRAATGAALCKSGSTTGWTCGRVKGYNVSVTYTNPNTGTRTYVSGLGTSTVCTEGGDSGGAYISGNQAQGMTSGGPTNQQCGGPDDEGSSYFQPLDDTLRYYGLTLNTN